MKKVLVIHLLFLVVPKLFAFNAASVPKKLSAHYVAESQALDMVKNKLQNNGFHILAITPILKNQHVITITNQELQNTNSYMATLQVNVNETEIRVQNPSYLAAAYLSKNYRYGQFKATINALERSLGTLHNGFQQAELSSLGEYRFMYGLPKKEDTLTVKQASNILEKISSESAKKYIAYTLTLPNGSILVGHKLRERTNRFLQILGEEKNAQILPYEVMIKGDKVSMMNPKYYLALSLPQLSLREFMEIASVPDRIYRNIKKAYQ